MPFPIFRNPSDWVVVDAGGGNINATNNISIEAQLAAATDYVALIWHLVEVIPE